METLRHSFMGSSRIVCHLSVDAVVWSIGIIDGNSVMGLNEADFQNYLKKNSKNCGNGHEASS
ncbi:MAG: hypothetical protein KHX20_09085 [Megasphaera sp.]|jgi:hypothetical protein|nr:hypothetical protein [Megasphaera sp.]